MDYARKLKAARTRLKLSQSEAAAKWGISLKTLQNWEQGISKPRGLYQAHFRKLFPDAAPVSTGGNQPRPRRQK